MKTMKRITFAYQDVHRLDRRGAVLVLAVAMLLVVFGIAAFTVDFGILNVTKGQIQNAADSAALAATQDLIQGIGPGATVTSQVAAANAGQTARDMVHEFRSGDVNSTNLSIDRDVRFGRRSWDPNTQTWVKAWGSTPYNMVEVTVRRTQAAGAPLGSVFSKVLGFNSFDVEARSVASVNPSTGFTIPPGSNGGSGGAATIDLLPIALDLTTWNNLVSQISTNTSYGFQDQRSYNSSTHSIHTGSDGIPEVNIYPDANSNMPPGNRGTVDIGSSNNSTNDLKRQIQYGINASDLSYFPNGILKFNDQGVLYLNGDTGISAGIEAALKSIIGDVRAIPIFIDVSGPGNNAQYTIVKFVGVRIMAVKLTGGPTQRYVSVQPAPYSTRLTTRGNALVNVDSILTQPLLIE
jgi:Flp pilus assembly protein TadG